MATANASPSMTECQIPSAEIPIATGVARLNLTAPGTSSSSLEESDVGLNLGNNNNSPSQIPTAAMGVTPTIPADSGEIDSALLAALREPRERVGLLRLETALVDFMQCDAGWLEVGGPYNSVIIGPMKKTLSASAANASSLARPTTFQRCILHRLADRFGIVRETGSLLAGSLRLIKLPVSRTPDRLLQDLEPAEYALPNDINNNVNNGYVGAQNIVGAPSSNCSDGLDINAVQTAFSNQTLEATANTLPVTSSPAQKPRKVKIMKRTDKKGGQLPKQGSSSTPSGRRRSSRRISDVTDREKAYADARARIFGEDDSNNANALASTDDGGNNLGDSGEIVTANKVDQISSTEEVTSGGDTSKEKSTSPSSTGSAPMPRSSSGNNLKTPESVPAAATNITVESTKAVYRNRAEEAADPDFRRGVAATSLYAPVVGTPVGSAAPVVAVIQPGPNAPSIGGHGVVNAAPHALHPSIPRRASWTEYTTHANLAAHHHHQQQQQHHSHHSGVRSSFHSANPPYNQYAYQSQAPGGMIPLHAGYASTPSMQSAVTSSAPPPVGLTLQQQQHIATGSLQPGAPVFYPGQHQHAHQAHRHHPPSHQERWRTNTAPAATTTTTGQYNQYRRDASAVGPRGRN